METLISILIDHEGLKKLPYVDTMEKTSIGIGRNLTDRGISREEAIYLCLNDVKESRSELSNYQWYESLDDVRKDVLVELHFNIGLSKLLKFDNMIQSLILKKYADAATHMLDSAWRKQVGDRRALNMAKRLSTGKY
jgi:lysozyme